MTGTVTKKRWAGSMLLITAAAVLWLLLPASFSQAATNGRIAYQTNVHATDQIYTMNSDGSDKVRVASHVGYNDREPGITQDGSKIAFNSDLSPVGIFQIYTMGVDGSGLVQLTTNDFQNVGPEFSPDGTRVTFASNQSGDWEIYTISLTTGVETRLTNNAVLDGSPSFSRDGQTVVYSCQEIPPDIPATVDRDICAVSSDGSGLHIKIRDSSSADNAPQYSPDGSRIVFYSGPADGSLNTNEIYTMPAAGGAAAPLTTNTFADTNPVYSPDGTRIAFDTNRNDNTYDIYTMDTNGSNLVQLTSGTANEQHPSWANAVPEIPLPTPTPPDSALSIRCTSPKLNADKTKRLSRKRLARYMSSGFKCVIENPSSVNALGASLVRTKKVTKKSRSKTSKKRKKVTRCYRVDSPKTKIGCSTTKSDGLTLEADASGNVLVNYKPLARKRKGKVRHTNSAKRLLKRMSKGKILRRGTYRLTFAAHVQTQTSPKKTKKKYFRFYFRVNK